MLHGLLSDAEASFGVLRRGAADEVVNEGGYLIAALAQRGDRQADDVQAVVQVLTEAAILNELLEVGVGGGDDAHVDVDGRELAERVDLARFEEPQELGLKVETEVANLVEEQGAVLGGPDEALVVAIGAREGAAALAKELALEELARDGGAVEGDKGFVGAVGMLVDRAGDDFLAGAAFPGNRPAICRGSFKSIYRPICRRHDGRSGHEGPSTGRNSGETSETNDRGHRGCAEFIPEDLVRYLYKRQSS